MSELAEVTAIMKEMRKEKRASKEPGRVDYAIKQLKGIGYNSAYDTAEKCVLFAHGGNVCKIYPFTGWWTGKGIGSGRGIKKLIKKLKGIQ